MGTPAIRYEVKLLTCKQLSSEKPLKNPAAQDLIVVNNLVLYWLFVENIFTRFKPATATKIAPFPFDSNFKLEDVF